MTTAADALDQGRKAFQEHSWGQAYACLSAADQEASLGSDDLERVDQLIRLEKHPGLDPALKYMYPSSLLYFVSGVVEDDVDMPIVGL